MRHPANARPARTQAFERIDSVGRGGDRKLDARGSNQDRSPHFPSTGFDTSAWQDLRDATFLFFISNTSNNTIDEISGSR
jgi:hypothetical protein